MSDSEQPAPVNGGQHAEWQERPAPNQRRFQRAHVDMVVQLRFGNVQQFLDATAEDLSVGGMFLRSEHAAPGGQLREIGQIISLQFDAGARRVVEGLGRVVRVVTPDSPGVVPGVGIEFVELDDRSRQLIETIVAIKLAPTGSG
jgi:c-di-GMP-binding flagellar brake protein YcgR